MVIIAIGICYAKLKRDSYNLSDRARIDNIVRSSYESNGSKDELDDIYIAINNKPGFDHLVVQNNIYHSGRSTGYQLVGSQVKA